MASNRRNSNGNLFRVLVFPAWILYLIFRKPAFQWLAVVAVAVWLCVMLISAMSESAKRRKHRRSARQLATMRDGRPANQKREDASPESELNLLRETNLDISQALKRSFPAASWSWQQRPSVNDLKRGGTWRILTANTDPFNGADVTIKPDGDIVIAYLQTAWSETPAVDPQNDDLQSDELLKRVDVKSWYQSGAADYLSELIDDLNAQGVKSLFIREDGSLWIRSGGNDMPIDTLDDFPPRSAWDTLSRLMSEDNIAATVEPDCLRLAWQV